MKAIKSILCLAALLCLCQQSHAQLLKDPTTWTYEVKQKKDHVYQLIFHVKLAGDWHIYALNPGTDKSVIPPSFHFNPAKNVQLIGKVKEIGKPRQLKIEGLDGVFRIFSGKADYVQEVKVNGVASINGELEYQVCNDKTCLPSKKKPFAFQVR